MHEVPRQFEPVPRTSGDPARERPDVRHADHEPAAGPKKRPHAPEQVDGCVPSWGFLRATGITGRIGTRETSSLAGT